MNNLKKRIEEKGITLVALVITIIIIIILAAITINIAFGDNGLVNQAKNVKQDAEDMVNEQGGKINGLLQEYSNIMSENENTGGGDTYPTVEEKLKEGDYVYYEDGTGATRECVVLYGPENANYEDYGIQIITMETVEYVTLGYDDPTVTGSDNFTKSMNSYNNAISTLNNATSKYLNTTYAESVRCVGSVPDNSDSESGYYTFTEFSSSYSGLLRDTDKNYLTDYNQMSTLTIRDIDERYWLASRNVLSASNRRDFCVCYVDTSGTVSIGGGLCLVRASGTTNSFSNSYGLRPVFTLKSGIKVKGGTGEKDNPYTLGI